MCRHIMLLRTVDIVITSCSFQIVALWIRGSVPVTLIKLFLRMYNFNSRYEKH